MTIRWAGIAFVVGACFGIFMGLPASLFIPASFDERVDVYGSVVNGQASFSEPISATVSWDLDRLPIFWLQFSGRFAVVGNGIDVEGELSLRSSTLSLKKVNGTIQAGLLNRLLRSEGASLEKSLTVSLHEAIFSVDERTIKSMSGVLAWPGGQVRAQDLRGKPIHLGVPALRGLISTSSEGVELIISEENGPQAARFLLDYEGVVTEVVLKHVQTWANVAFNGSGDDVLFKRQRRLYGRQ